MLATPAAQPRLDSRAGRQRHADRLWGASGVLLALMPLAMALANRSALLVITLAAVAALAATAVEGGLSSLAAALRAAALTPLGSVLLAFAAWGALSLTWSGAVSTSLHQFGEFLLPCLAAGVLALTLPGRVAPARAFGLLGGAMVAAALVIAADQETGLALRRALGGRAVSFIYNRPALTLLVLLPPVLVLAAAAIRSRALGRAAGALLALLVVATVLRSDSGAAVLGLGVGALAYAGARLWPRGALGLMALGFVLLFAAAPFLGVIADRLIPERVHAGLSESHSRDRIEIWQSFGAAIRAEPYVGQGFGVSPRFRELRVAAKVDPQYRTLLAVGHPHNAVVQVWAELGLVGAALALAALLLLLRGWLAWPGARLAPPLALLAAASAVASVGHGAWQGWWPAALGAAVVWFRVADGAPAPSLAGETSAPRAATTPDP